MFPGMDSVAVSDYKGINATNIREDLLSFPNEKYYKRDMPNPAQKVIENIINKDYWALLKQEYEMIQEYKDSWKYAPYPPTFVTTDAVVIQSGHILLVRRGHAPGIGQWALPGGFLNQTETLLDGCIRELREETRLKVPAPVLKGSIKGQHTFDDPNRSSRGRTITNAFYFELTPMEELPKVKGSDDAIEAKWFKLSELDSKVMFEDHYGIIDYFVGL
jgi:bifunctional NMN adenylyltransferase/nudix hydrolase